MSAAPRSDDFVPCLASAMESAGATPPAPCRGPPRSSRREGAGAEGTASGNAFRCFGATTGGIDITQTKTAQQHKTQTTSTHNNNKHNNNTSYPLWLHATELRPPAPALQGQPKRLQAGSSIKGQVPGTPRSPPPSKVGTNGPAAGGGPDGAGLGKHLGRRRCRGALPWHRRH